MESLNKLNNEKLDVISKFNEQELMVLIDSLSKKYYSDYIDGNINKCKSTIALMNDVIFMFEDDMKFLHQYINFSFLKHANFIIKTIYKHDDVFNGFEMDVESINPTYSLSASIRKSFKVKIDKVDKVNIKHLHDLVVNDENMDDNVVELVNALYDSFLAKEDDESDERNSPINVDGGDA